MATAHRPRVRDRSAGLTKTARQGVCAPIAATSRAARTPLRRAPSMRPARSPAECSPANTSGPTGAAIASVSGSRPASIALYARPAPWVVLPGRQHRRGRLVDLQLGCGRAQPSRPCVRAGGHLQPLERRQRAGEGRDDAGVGSRLVRSPPEPERVRHARDRERLDGCLQGQVAALAAWPTPRTSSADRFQSGSAGATSSPRRPGSGSARTAASDRTGRRHRHRNRRLVPPHSESRRTQQEATTSGHEPRTPARPRPVGCRRRPGTTAAPRSRRPSRPGRCVEAVGRHRARDRHPHHERCAHRAGRSSASSTASTVSPGRASAAASATSGAAATRSEAVTPARPRCSRWKYDMPVDASARPSASA